MKRTQNGFAHIGLILVVVVAFGAISYVAYGMLNKSTPAGTTVSGIYTAKPTMPASINNTADLKKATAVVNSTSTSTINASAVDGDLTSLL